MVTRVYGTTVIPGDEITVLGGGTIAVSTAFARDMGIVGGMNVSEGTATEGEIEEVSSITNAENLFGEESELARAIRAAISNGVRTVYAVGVPESSATESVVDENSGVLDNFPLFDPSVHPEHDIVVTVGALEFDVRMVYEAPNPADAGSDEVLINPATGAWAADDENDYEFEYDYGDYSDAIVDVADRNPRTLALLTESVSLSNELAAELSNNATYFGFTHGLVGATPDLDSSDYDILMDDPRMSVVAPARSYTDDAETEQVRTIAAVGGLISSLPLGQSSTYKSLSGLTGLAQEFTPNQAGELIDEGILPVMRDGRILIVKDMTTSTDVRFERVYSNEVVDECTQLSHLISQQFIGDQNTEDNRGDLDESHRTAYSEMVEDRPPLLDDYTVEVEEGDEPNSVTLTIGLDVVNVIDTIDVKIVVGDIITNGGAE